MAHAWVKCVVSRDVSYVAEVLDLWVEDHRYLTDRDMDDLVCEAQVLVFVGEPGKYYVRIAPNTQAGEFDYTQASCLPKPFKTLQEAKAAAEMLLEQGIYTTGQRSTT